MVGSSSSEGMRVRDMGQKQVTVSLKGHTIILTFPEKWMPNMEIPYLQCPPELLVPLVNQQKIMYTFCIVIKCSLFSMI
uniref:Uncharacterized protein n=1 Tax=Anguilla anguilla TaxID=7936 RepID=A0A0E9WXI9_ANGAN